MERIRVVESTWIEHSHHEYDMSFGFLTIMT